MGNRYNYEFDMKFTNNPYIDLIVNCVKILGMNAVVKNENQALHYEDARSATEAAKLIKYKEGHWDRIKNGEYNEYCYMEWNSYYRMLNGLPPAYSLNDEKAYFSATGFTNDIYEDIGNAYIVPELYKRYFIDMGQYDENLSGRYLHELDDDELSVIEANGTLDQIKTDYSEDSHYQYIYHLGDKKIDFYTARKAVNFSLLYLPKLNTFDIIENKFRRVYDRNRKYTMSTVYSEAYRFMSYHYDAFIQILIIIQTMVDLISEVQEYIINKDVFDSRTIRYLFESYGIAYYKEIPVKYQIRIIKNVNKLLKYKSSHRNITDIIELFDDDTITVFTYYLMKTKRIHRDDFYYYTENDINPKYNTNRDYYLGRPEDITNNKIPLLFYMYNKDDVSTTTDPETHKVTKENFIKTHIYGYTLDKPARADTDDNRMILASDYQPIVGKISESLPSIRKESISNSFLCDFLNNIAIGNNKLPWFGAEDFNKRNNPTKYLENRNTFLNRFKIALGNLLKYTFIEEKKKDPEFALNQFYCQKIKYKIYDILGVFDYDDTIDFDNISDAELSNRFYDANTVITEKFCTKHNSNYNLYINSDNKYLLNHTIPFMVWMEYKENQYSISNPSLSKYIGNKQYYIFNSNNSFAANTYSLGDLYEQYTKVYRENYCTSVRIFVESVFDDLKYDKNNNPSPRYNGWIDIEYVIAQTGKLISELKLGDKISTKNENNIPIYNAAYIYETITKDMVGLEYYRKNYDLCFLKVPMLDPNAYKVIEKREMRKGYDNITLPDPFWDGVSTFDILTDEERDKLHISKKQDILNKEFTIERTKYIAVEASIDLVKMSYQISYFMNMLYDKHMDEENLFIEVDPEISTSKVKLNDLLTFAIALNFIYNGVEPDNIASDMEKNMYINGFNFDTDWNDIYNYLENKYFINNNYNNDLHTYSYIDENGNTITNYGYGMSPNKKGWMVEIFDDWIVYDKDKDIKTFKGYPIYGYNKDGTPIFYYDDEENKPSIPKDINTILNHRSLYIDQKNSIPNPQIGAFLSGRYSKCDLEKCEIANTFGFDFGNSDIWKYNLENHPEVDIYGSIYTIDIAWKPTQYGEDNNSHALWLDTHILTCLDENTSDLDKINMLKKIYSSNTNLYDHLTYMLRHAESKRMYDIYKILFDSFMETKMNHEYYGLIDNNKNPVFNNENNINELFYINTIEEVLYDNEGFPYFHGYKMDDNNDSIDIGVYHLIHSDDFIDCKYVNKDGDFAWCQYNESIFEKTGIREYIIQEDDQNQLPRKYYMTPIKDNCIFMMEVSVNSYLVNKENPNSKIQIWFDKNGDIIDDEGKKILDNDYPYKYVIDKDGNVSKILKTIKSDNHEIIINRKISESYYDFLQYRNPNLYSHLIDLKYNYKDVPVMDSNNKVSHYVPSDDKRKRIENLCELIVVALEKYFDRKEWKYLFNLIPTANMENIQNYIMKMVVFFKSWKTQILDTAVNYIIDDPYNNHIHILDDMYYNTTFDNLLEKIRPKEYKYFLNKVHYKDPIYIKDEVKLENIYFEPYQIEFGFGEKLYGHKFDYPDLTSVLNFKDNIQPGEKVSIKIVSYTGDVQIDSKGNILLP